MNRTFSNTLSVLLATAFTVLVVVATVQVSGALAGFDSGSTAIAVAQSVGAGSAHGYGSGTSASGSTSGTTLTCPRTGCTASYCHATAGR